MQRLPAFSGGLPPQRTEANVTVYPDAIERVYTQAKETLVLFDSIPAIGIFLNTGRPGPIGIQLDPSLCRFLKADETGIWYSLLEAPGQALLASPRKNQP
ncbi:MAG: hypothetical protein IPJ00_20650, partial [Saprospirales bacterium]|nr:hypothetical protein [Saprospirales bacterium]